MSRRKQFYSSDEAVAEILRQLDEDADSDTDLEENAIEVSAEADILEEVMDNTIPESLINNITQRDKESSDESEDDYFVNESNDGDATNLAMYKSRDGTFWSKNSSNSSQGRRGVENIVRAQGGATRFILNRVDTSKDVFEELLGISSLLNIQKYTVAEAKRQGNNTFDLSIDELKAFLGLCIIRGVIKGRDKPLCSFWENSYGRRIFGETMARNKFQLVLRYIRFDEKATQTQRRGSDKFAAIRELWERVMLNCQNAFFPHANVTIDKQLFPCRSRCPFIQYMPQKPAKFGIKFWMICDVDTYYVLQAFPYTGKTDRIEEGLGDHVVMKLMNPYFETGLNVTTDNFFTNLSTAKKLKKHKITMVGTVRQNRKEIPEEIKFDKKDELYSSRFLFSASENIMMCSYKAKKAKNVYLLSSMHNVGRVDDGDPKRRPEAILFYNETKGGVDTADEMLRGYSTKAASRRWPLAAFFNLLDIVCLDAYVICKDVGIENVSRRRFLLQLGEALCDVERKRRKPSTLRLPATVGNHSGDYELPDNKRTSCRSCQKNKTRVRCENCKAFVCGTCSKPVCLKCLPETE